VACGCSYMSSIVREAGDAEVDDDRPLDGLLRRRQDAMAMDDVL
jgi:hypothetical protein